MFLGVLLCSKYGMSQAGTEVQAGIKSPAVDWIRAQEDIDVAVIEAELAARDEAERALKEQKAVSLAGSSPEAEALKGAEDSQEVLFVPEAPPAEAAAEEPPDRETLRRRLGQAVIVGDSVAQGFLDYQYLEANAIIARRGLRADTAGEEIEKALALSPSQLFLSMGLNDLEYCNGDSGRFIAEYEKRIQEIREVSPDLPVYVNGILPVLPAAVEEKETMGCVAAFNEALRDMCLRLGLVYIDSSDLLEGHEDWYQLDAVHLKPMFYPLWLDRMEEMAGL